MVKIAIILIIFSFNAIVICWLFNIFLSIPVEKGKELNFYFTDDNRNLVSELHLDNKIYDLDASNYKIKLNLDLANSYFSDKTDNYEIEMQVYSIYGQIKTYKKMFFFHRYDTMLQTLVKLITLPIRVFGYYNSNLIEIELVDRYDNYSNSIEKITIYIKNTSLNINMAILKFIPEVGWIKLVLYYFKYIWLPVLFVSFVMGQTIIIFLLYYFYKKPTEIHHT
jgi:hypothetical protein